MFDPREKIAIFIDGNDLWQASRSLDFEVDYRALMKFFNQNSYVLRTYYYTVVQNVAEGSYNSVQKLIDWLEYNGFTVRTKTRDSNVRNMNIEITLECVSLIEHVDHFVLFTNDGNMCPLVQYLQRSGNKVTVVGAQHAMHDSLRRTADHVITLDDIVDDIAREDGGEDVTNIAVVRKSVPA